MPHMCTRCNSVFEDGMDILEGCPVCGWNKFLFVRSKEKIKEVRGALKASEIGGPYEPWPEGNDSLREILRSDRGREANRTREGRDDRPKEVPKKRGKSVHGFSDLDPPKDRSSDPPHRGSDERRSGEDKDPESIMMQESGTYELNLPNLFERDELVMAVKEGTYLIDLSSAFKKSKKS